MADTKALAKLRGRVVTVEGKTVLVFGTGGGRQLQDKKAVQQRIAMLDEHIDNRLPAAKAKLDGEKIVAERVRRIDATVAKLESMKAGLDPATVLAEEQANIDGKIGRLSEVRAALASAVDELDELPQE